MNRVIIEWLYEVDPDRAWDILVTQAQGFTRMELLSFIHLEDRAV